MTGEKAVEVSTTVASEEEASVIAERVVRGRLAACAQVSGPLTSHYTWKGEYFREREWKVSMKTLASRERELTELVLGLHSYETPELTATVLEGVSPGYMEWMESVLGS